ncbi:MAG: SDR family oxidoreductase [Chitinophagales bacterium]
MYEQIFHQQDISQKAFLITGGAGFIGSNIVEYLLKHKAKKVRVLDNLSTGSWQNVKRFEHFSNYEFIEGNICNFNTCVKACKAINYVSHQAALGSVPRSVANPMATTEVNVNGFVNMLKAAEEQHIETFVYASSSSVYGDEPNLPKVEHRIGKPLSPYAASKLANEIFADVFAKIYAMNIIGFRYFNVFGPHQSPNGPYAAVIPLFVQALKKEKTCYINGDGQQTRDFTFVENAVQANILGMTTTNSAAFNQAYNIAFGERFSINDLFNIISELLKTKQKPVFRETRKGDVKHSLANIEKAKRLLNYEPQISFKTGLEITLNTIQ